MKIYLNGPRKGERDSQLQVCGHSGIQLCSQKAITIEKATLKIFFKVNCLHRDTLSYSHI